MRALATQGFARRLDALARFATHDPRVDWPGPYDFPEDAILAAFDELGEQIDALTAERDGATRAAQAGEDFRSNIERMATAGLEALDKRAKEKHG